MCGAQEEPHLDRKHCSGKPESALPVPFAPHVVPVRQQNARNHHQDQGKDANDIAGLLSACQLKGPHPFGYEAVTKLGRPSGTWLVLATFPSAEALG
jgi:hypothetical protein